MGFEKIIVAGKSPYVFTIKGDKDKAAEWKNRLELSNREWGAKGVPLCRVKADSPTFGKVVLLFYFDRLSTSSARTPLGSFI